MLVKVDIDTALKYSNRKFIDIRSPFEFQEGTIPEAINIPLFDNEERIEIGKIYKSQGEENAKKRGLEIIAPKLPHFYEKLKALSQGSVEIIVFCARGGLRSTSFVNFFNGIGLNLVQLEGGFKNYRNHLLKYLENLYDYHDFIVLHGYTGVGKTEILDSLNRMDIATIDLEALASNKGSVFGEAHTQDNKLTQKDFENSLIQALILTKERHILVESESQRLGQVMIPKTIYEMMGNGKHIIVNTTIENRISRLVEDYVNTNPKHEEVLIRGLQFLKKRMGKEKVESFIKMINDKNYCSVAKELIIDYYDPLYKSSIEKFNYDLKINYDKIEEAVEKISIYYHEIEGKFNE